METDGRNDAPEEAKIKIATKMSVSRSSLVSHCPNPTLPKEVVIS